MCTRTKLALDSGKCSKAGADYQILWWGWGWILRACSTTGRGEPITAAATNACIAADPANATNEPWGHDASAADEHDGWNEHDGHDEPNDGSDSSRHVHTVQTVARSLQV